MNQVHKWKQLPMASAPRDVRLRQDWRILQAAMHHASHHVAMEVRRHLVLKHLLDPVLDAAALWPTLEIAVDVLTGRRLKPELSRGLVDHRASSPDDLARLRAAASDGPASYGGRVERCLWLRSSLQEGSPR